MVVNHEIKNWPLTSELVSNPGITGFSCVSFCHFEFLQVACVVVIASGRLGRRAMGDTRMAALSWEDDMEIRPWLEKAPQTYRCMTSTGTSMFMVAADL